MSGETGCGSGARLHPNADRNVVRGRDEQTKPVEAYDIKAIIACTRSAGGMNSMLNGPERIVRVSQTGYGSCYHLDGRTVSSLIFFC